MVASRSPLPVNPQEILNYNAKHVQRTHSLVSHDNLNCKLSPYNVGSVPKIDDLPLLDSDSSSEEGVTADHSEIVESRAFKPKLRRYQCIHFEDSTMDHPLMNNHSEITPKSGSKPNTHSDFIPYLFALLSTANLPTRNVPRFTRRPLSPMMQEEIEELSISNRGAIELIEYRRTLELLRLPPTRRFMRANPSYLRMYVAEKRMIHSGKLTRLTCGPFIPPRKDSANNVPTKYLEIPCKWNKKPQRRTWVQLN